MQLSRPLCPSLPAPDSALLHAQEVVNTFSHMANERFITHSSSVVFIGTSNSIPHLSIKAYHEISTERTADLLIDFYPSVSSLYPHFHISLFLYFINIEKRSSILITLHCFDLCKCSLILSAILIKFSLYSLSCTVSYLLL